MWIGVGTFALGKRGRMFQRPSAHCDQVIEVSEPPGEGLLPADIVAKVFLGRRTKFLRAADAFYVRDHIVSSKIDHRPP
jgi:hypothetical protein